jgi:hypothetical protein
MRGVSAKRALYLEYIDEEDELIRKILRGEEIQAPYLKEAEILASQKEASGDIIDYLRKILELEHTLEELSSLKLMFQRRIKILLLIFQIVLPTLSSMIPLISIISFIGLTLNTPSLIEVTIPRNILIYSSIHGISTEIISTYYLCKIGELRTWRNIIRGIILFITIYIITMNMLSNIGITIK